MAGAGCCIWCPWGCRGGRSAAVRAWRARAQAATHAAGQSRGRLRVRHPHAPRRPGGLALEAEPEPCAGLRSPCCAPASPPSPASSWRTCARTRRHQCSCTLLGLCLPWAAGACHAPSSLLERSCVWLDTSAAPGAWVPEQPGPCISMWQPVHWMAGSRLPPGAAQSWTPQEQTPPKDQALLFDAQLSLARAKPASCRQTFLRPSLSCVTKRSACSSWVALGGI